MEQISNCWRASLLPFDSADRNSHFVKDYQLECISRGVFGVGFSTGDPMKPGAEMVKRRLDDGLELSEALKGTSKYLKPFFDVHVGDLILVLLRDGHHYIGKTKSEVKWMKDDPDMPRLKVSSGRGRQKTVVKKQSSSITWGCEIEWIEVPNMDEIPASLAGALRYGTIRRMKHESKSIKKGIDIEVYDEPLMKLLWKRVSKEQITEDEKIELAENNFGRALSYMDLEDVVASYITSTPQYALFRIRPSSCKLSQIKYEYLLTSPDGSKITAQVKNQCPIPQPEEYLNDVVSNVYKKIFLFSAEWTTDEAALHFKNEAIKTLEINSNWDKSKHGETLEFILPSKLFSFLKHSPEARYLRNKISKYYHFHDSEDLSAS